LDSDKTQRIAAFVLFAATCLSPLAIVGCAKPVGEAAIGDTVEVYVIRDLRTGKCLQVDAVGKYNRATVVPDADCEPRR
jgi:hypothetical protein